jgi:hypothetical protein
MAVDGEDLESHNAVVEQNRPECDLDEWFTDERGLVRRMHVRWHPERRLVVLSLWKGPNCTATFRLPVEDAARLIGVLADSLAGACALPGPPVGGTRPWSLSRLRAWLKKRRRDTTPTFAVFRGG